MSYHRVFEDERLGSFVHTTDHEDDHDKDGYMQAIKHHRPYNSTRILHICSYILVCVSSLLVGLAAGGVFNLDRELDGFPGPYGNTRRAPKNVVWHQNDTFASEPSEESEHAWKSLIPNGRGFVQHPKLAKESKCVSVIHELHCLHGIRTAYFTYAYLFSKAHHVLADSTPSLIANHAIPDHIIPPFIPNPFLDAQLVVPGYGHNLNSHHMNHCFDYLRQALMCAADSNLEDVITINGTSGTLGYGSQRVCRDFDAVKSWSEKWRDSDYGGIV